MKIVILDTAVNPGDIDFSPWYALQAPDGTTCQVEIFDRTEPADTVARCQGAEVVLTNKVIIDEAVMAQLPMLRYVGVLATGYNVVDTEAASRRGIVVTNIPAYSTDSVAQMVFAHLLNITNHVALHSQAVSQGQWQACPVFSFALTPLWELSHRTMGIVGLGNTGMQTARIALAMGMRVLAVTSKDAEALPEGIQKASGYDELFAQADVISLHCPLTPDTHHLIDAHALSLMKPTAILINTGRGPLLDEVAVAEALRQQRIYAAGIDVLTQEPPRDGSPLIGLPNCFITPHIAWATSEARARLWDIATRNVQAFLSGSPQNQVN